MLLGAHLLASSLFLGGETDTLPGIPSSTGTGRFVSSEEFARLTTGNYGVFARVRIPDPAGTVWEYANRDGFNWIHSLDWEMDANAPIGTATVKLWREIGNRSLAPLRANSAYNQIAFPGALLDDAGNTIIEKGPSIDAGRRITIDVATPELGTDPNAIADSAWHTVFDGYLDSVDAAPNPMVLEARDPGGLIQDTWFPVPNVIAPTDPAIQSVLAELLDLLHLDVSIPLYVPNPPDPEVDLSTFTYDIEAGMDVLQRVAQVIGWDLRFKWSDADQAMRFTFSDPGRTKTVTDYELPPTAYIDIKQQKIDVTGIRNDVTISFRPDNDTGTPRQTVNKYDPESVFRYHRRSMVLQEADDSPINSTDSATLMAELIVFDLASPVGDQIVDMPFFWPVQLYDFIGFTPNGVTHDDPLNLGVVSVKHRLDDAGNRTTLQARGRPGSPYWNWLGRRPALPGQTKPQDPTGTTQPGGFASLSQTPNYSTDHITINWAWGGDPTAEFEVWVQQGSTGFNLITTNSAGVLTYDYDVGEDIEPFRLPPDPPQIAIEIDVYIRAVVSGAVIGTSATNYASYGFGP